MALARCRRVSGRQMVVVIGHATFCGLVSRETLSSSGFVCFYTAGETFAPLLPTVADELQALAGLMVFLVSPWKFPWNGHVLATDACEPGWGTCRAIHKQAAVASVGRVRE